MLFIQCKYSIKVRQYSWGTGSDGQAALSSSILKLQRQRQIIFSLPIAAAPLIHISTQRESASPAPRQPVTVERLTAHFRAWATRGRGSWMWESVYEHIYNNPSTVMWNEQEPRPRRECTAPESSRRLQRGQGVFWWEVLWMHVTTHTAPARSYSPSVAALKCNCSMSLFSHRSYGFGLDSGKCFNIQHCTVLYWSPCAKATAEQSTRKRAFSSNYRGIPPSSLYCKKRLEKTIRNLTEPSTLSFIVQIKQTSFNV